MSNTDLYSYLLLPLEEIRQQRETIALLIRDVAAVRFALDTYSVRSALTDRAHGTFLDLLGAIADADLLQAALCDRLKWFDASNRLVWRDVWNLRSDTDRLELLIQAIAIAPKIDCDRRFSILSAVPPQGSRQIDSALIDGLEQIALDLPPVDNLSGRFEEAIAPFRQSKDDYIVEYANNACKAVWEYCEDLALGDNETQDI